MTEKGAKQMFPLIKGSRIRINYGAEPRWAVEGTVADINHLGFRLEDYQFPTGRKGSSFLVAFPLIGQIEILEPENT